MFVSKHASRNTMEAANVLGRGLSMTLPTSPNKMPGLIDPDFTKLTIDRGLQDKNAPWVSVGVDPDLGNNIVGKTGSCPSRFVVIARWVRWEMFEVGDARAFLALFVHSYQLLTQGAAKARIAVFSVMASCCCLV